MYYDYFGLKQPPFRITPDTKLFFPGGNRGAILDALVYAITSGEGIVKVVGEVGSGKTMLCRMLEKELPDRVEIVYLANPSLSPENILHAIGFELKLPIQSGTSRLQVMNKLQQYLVERHAENRQVVVFVEEAQSMPLATLEEIRLLSNLETQQNKLLQIVLFGQPELDEMLSQPHVRQLKERITYSFRLNPFNDADIREYLNSRLRACGYRAGDLFLPGAIEEIERYSLGLARRINVLADKSLLAAYAGNGREIDAGHVRKAARDSEFVTGWARNRRHVQTAAVAGAVLLVIVILVWGIAGTPGSREAPRLAEPSGETGEAMPPPAPAAPDLPAEEVPAAPAGDVSEGSPGGLPAESGAQPVAAMPDEPSAVTEAEAEPEAQSVPPSGGGGKVLSSGPRSVDRSGAEAGPDTAPAEDQLLGFGTVLELQDLGDSRLSSRESDILQKQLRILPPEGLVLNGVSPRGDACRLCWSIIYRPVVDAENL